MTKRQLTITLTLWTMLVAGAWYLRPVEAQPLRGQPFVCEVVNSTSTALTAFVSNGSTIASCAAVPGQAMFITDVTASASGIATTTADQFLELKVGTGTACATGTVTIWAADNLALTAVVANFTTPIRVPQNTDLCWMDNTTGNKHFVVTGYYGL